MLYKGIVDSLSSFLIDHPHEVDKSSFKNKLFLYSFLWKVDDKLLELMRSWIQVRLIETLELPEERREVLIATWLCYLPYVLPIEGSIYKIPLKEAKWALVEYKVGQIVISPKGLPSSHQYRVYTLEAEGVPSWMVFMGTAYPSYPGFWSTIMGDLLPGEIGRYISCWNRKKVIDWLDYNPNCKVAGMSLGSRLVKQMTVDADISVRYLIKPALPYKASQPDQIDKMVVMERDPVSRIGRIHDDARLIFIEGKKSCDCMSCFLLSHAQPRLTSLSYSMRDISGKTFNKVWPVRYQRLWYHMIRGFAFILILPFWVISFLMGWLTDIFSVLKTRLSLIN